jgi:ferritin-like metal-binding protein YciE
MGDMFERAKSRVLDRIESPRDLLEFKLGSALKMENTVLDMLGKLEEEANRPALKQQLSHHADETRGQITNIEKSFAALGIEPDDKPCPVIEAIEKEGRANVKMAGDQMVDAVILSGCAETEHHEIAVYETLITLAESQGHQDVVGRLRENLEQEQHTLEEVSRAMRDTAGQLAHAG